MYKINETAIGKNEQTSGLKILIFWLHYITKYFADIKFPNKESMTTQTFAFSKLHISKTIVYRSTWLGN